MMRNSLKTLGFLLIASSLLLLNCTQSGRRRVTTRSESNSAPKSDANVVVSSSPDFSGKEKTVVKMIKSNSVYEIPLEINGKSMQFIFDTGAGMISITEKELNELRRNGRFSDSEITGRGKFVDANGDVTEKVIVQLRSVKIGNRLINDIEASVEPNPEAPLLVGQSALEKFGKISIDYIREEISFE